MHKHRSRKWLVAALLLGGVSLGACDEFLDVSSPGRTADEDLNTADAFPALVTGMSYDLSDALDTSIETISLASVDLWHGGSYDFGDIPRGIILPEDVNGEWADMHQARWVAEQGIERMRTVYGDAGRPQAFESDALVARAYLLAGFANRLLGENVCQAVIDGSAAQPHTVHFDRAREQFSEAIRIGTAANATAIVNAAYGGRASIRAWLGDWAGAAEDAARVPAAFVYSAAYQLPDPDNTLALETTTRFEYTVYQTIFEEHPNDPRVPWQIVRRANGSVATGQNGSTPMYQQLKYRNREDDIPLVKGAEMLVLRAEAELRDNDVPGAFALLNQARETYGMAPLPVPTDLAAAWATLRYERRATTWLEARALWDLRRWNAATGPAHDPFLSQRDKCLPISENEMQSNINLRG
jgi:starch-binding outer membrane protein, SusD/RagB family